MDDLIADFRSAYTNRHKTAEDWRASGKKVIGYCYAGVPEEIVYAADMLPVQMVESEDTETVQRGEDIMPEYVCDYCQSLLGQTVMGDYAYVKIRPQRGRLWKPPEGDTIPCLLREQG